MLVELRDRTGSLDYINHAGQDLLKKVSSDQSSDKLSSDLEELNLRWTRLQAAAEERVNKYIATRDQLRHLKVLELCEARVSARQGYI